MKLKKISDRNDPYFWQFKSSYYSVGRMFSAVYFLNFVTDNGFNHERTPILKRNGERF